MYKAKTGVGCDGFHPKVPLILTKETRREIVEFLEKVEQSGKWPQQACTTMFFLIPKNVTSERPITLMPTLKHQKWQGGSRSIESSGAQPTGEVEELSVQCGTYCWKWRDLMERQKQKNKEPWLWS